MPRRLRSPNRGPVMTVSRSDATEIVTVEVKLPAWLWWKVATVAEGKDMSVAGFIADALREQCDLAKSPHRRLSQLDLLDEALSAVRDSRQSAKPSEHAVAEATARLTELWNASKPEYQSEGSHGLRKPFTELQSERGAA